MERSVFKACPWFMIRISIKDRSNSLSSTVLMSIFIAQVIFTPVKICHRHTPDNRVPLYNQVRIDPKTGSNPQSQGSEADNAYLFTIFAPSMPTKAKAPSLLEHADNAYLFTIFAPITSHSSQEPSVPG